MVKKVFKFLTILSLVLNLFGCSNKSSILEVTFIDVGQGDSALITCEGHSMLIDGGTQNSGEKVIEILNKKNIKNLDYLVISHLHEDHYGGLINILPKLSSIEKVLSNSTNIIESNGDSDSTQTTTRAFDKLEYELKLLGKNITVPKTGETFKLGDAIIKIVYNENNENNDSLVLLIEHGDNKFLFTGDIEYQTQKIISEQYNQNFPIDVLKVPHHGAYSNSKNKNNEGLYIFLKTFNPKFSVISVGKNNHGHPQEDTLSKLEDADSKVYRTDYDGDITFSSNGKTVKKI